MRYAARTIAALGLLACGQSALASSLLEQKVRMLETVVARAQSEPGVDADELRPVQRLLETAREALAGGDWEAVERAGDEGLRAATRLLSRGRASEPAPQLLRARLDERLRGVEQFRATLHSVLSERGELAVFDFVSLDRKVADSRRFAAEGRLADADRLARQAYDLVAQAMVRARDNETLHHRLVFASPEEEFRYEQDRYRSFRMLLDMALGELPPASPLSRDARTFAEAAGALHGQAEAFAAAGDHVRAIEAAEAGSAQLARALREAGVFLPY